MSIELHLYSDKSPTNASIEKVILPLGFEFKEDHVATEWRPDLGYTTIIEALKVQGEN